MKITKIPMTTTGGAIEQLNKDVYGKDPQNNVLTKPYNSSTPLQNRVDILEQAAAGLVVTKYIGPIAVAALDVPIAVGGQAAVDLLDVLVFSYNNPNHKKDIGAVMVIPTNVVNDPNFSAATDLQYVVTLTVFAGQIDISGHTKIILKGDSPEFKFEFLMTVDFVSESYVVAPSLVVSRNPITPELLKITNPGKFGDGDSVTKAVEDLDNIKADKLDTYTIAQADALLNAKEPSIQDTGWIDLTPDAADWSTTYCQIRKVGKLVNFRARAKRLETSASASIKLVAGYATIFRPSILIMNACYNLTDSSISRTFSYHDRSEIFATIPLNKEIVVNMMWFV